VVVEMEAQVMVDKMELLTQVEVLEVVEVQRLIMVL